MKEEKAETEEKKEKSQGLPTSKESYEEWKKSLDMMDNLQIIEKNRNFP